MNLTKRLRSHIVAEFKRGREMAENDRVFMLKSGTTEKLVRQALIEQAQANGEATQSHDQGKTGTLPLPEMEQGT